jgi:hypothetical protein
MAILEGQGQAVTVGIPSARTLLTLFILASVPLLLAIIINFPAKARVPEVGDVPQVEVILPAGEITESAFEVILDTGPVVAGHESKISAIALTAKPDDRAPGVTLLSSEKDGDFLRVA